MPIYKFFYDGSEYDDPYVVPPTPRSRRKMGELKEGEIELYIWHKNAYSFRDVNSFTHFKKWISSFFYDGGHVSLRYSYQAENYYISLFPAEEKIKEIRSKIGSLLCCILSLGINPKKLCISAILKTMAEDVAVYDRSQYTKDGRRKGQKKYHKSIYLFSNMGLEIPRMHDALQQLLVYWHPQLLLNEEPGVPGERESAQIYELPPGNKFFKFYACMALQPCCVGSGIGGANRIWWPRQNCTALVNFLLGKAGFTSDLSPSCVWVRTISNLLSAISCSYASGEIIRSWYNNLDDDPSDDIIANLILVFSGLNLVNLGASLCVPNRNLFFCAKLSVKAKSNTIFTSTVGGLSAAFMIAIMAIRLNEGKSFFPTYQNLLYTLLPLCIFIFLYFFNFLKGFLSGVNGFVKPKDLKRVMDRVSLFPPSAMFPETEQSPLVTPDTGIMPDFGPVL